ncbi:M48 family metalloprotease [Flavobacterium aciduliphilum]|uniref:Putative metalloprotease n=1 Tax=Flavobacterium aciduliphilum TaxID=1101402 RepID=A0A328YFJ3_9FLAO|nr:M48 family metalloprotease [Flavobacterium aciduliphilum]RAR72788.1 putative metalloprotease [Flavobacterium aciduliphilum]
MNKFSILLVTAFFAVTFAPIQAQIKLDERALGALQNGLASFTFSDSDAAVLSKAGVKKLDSINKVAASNDPYTLRLNRVFGKHSNENGLQLNYKVYLTKEVNAFATADGSVRVFSGLMDIMDDNQLLAVIGHEIGHVANHDSRDAMKVAYRKAFVLEGLASQSSTIAKATDSQAGQIGNAIIDCSYSRKQESEADLYSYEFMKRHGYDVNAVAAAFTILAKLSEGNEANFLTKIMSSHPDPKDRAEKAQMRAQADGLYKPYVQKPFSNKATTQKKGGKGSKKKK